MVMKILKKEFNNIFKAYHDRDTQIWVATGVNELDDLVIKLAIRLADLDFIKYVRICDQYLAASSENYQKRQKVPITDAGHLTAFGIEIIYHLDHRIVDFYSINSPIKGHGGQMVKAIMGELPMDWQPSVTMDWSDGFWDKMVEKYPEYNWMM
jgi:hypothetical protein